MYFIGFNIEGDPFYEAVDNWLLENEFGGDEDQKEEEGWGYMWDMYLESEFDEIPWNEFEKTGMETIIKSSNEHFEKVLEIAMSHGDTYFDENFKVVDENVFIDKVKSSSTCKISICDVRPDD